MSKLIDTLFSGAFFHTMLAEGEVYNYLGVKDGLITYISDTRPHKRAYNREVRLDGLHVYPSLTDAHLHLMYSIAIAAMGFHICEISSGAVVPDSIEGVGKRLSAYCKGRGDNDIIIANSYITQGIREKRMPTRQELDEWTGSRRAIVYTVDGHSSAMSTAMLNALDIESEGHDGRLTGTEHDFRQGRITEIMTESIGLRDIARGIASFVNQCASFGITRVCAFDGNGDSKNDTLMDLLAFIAPRLDIDVFLYPQYMDLERARPFWKKMRRPRIGGCGQWQMDGAVGSHSAAFYSPYADTGKTAACYYTQNFVNDSVQSADAEGCQIASHAIGDAAIDRILEAYDLLGSGKQCQCGKRCHADIPQRIEHFEFPSDEAVNKVIANGNIALAVQPGFAWIDSRYLKTYENYLPPDTIKQQLPLKRLYDAGIALCASSDSPVQNIDPFLQMLGMMEFSIQGQSLSNYEALYCYTMNPARITGNEDYFGTLETGKEASFFTCQTDLINCSHDAFSGVKALHTYIRGKDLRRKKGTLGEFAGMLFRRTKKI